MDFILFSPSLPSPHLFLTLFFFFLREEDLLGSFLGEAPCHFTTLLRQLWNPRGKFCLKNSPASCCPKLKLITFIKHYRSANVMHCYPQLMQSGEHLQYSGVYVCATRGVCKSCSWGEESRGDYNMG